MQEWDLIWKWNLDWIIFNFPKKLFFAGKGWKFMKDHLKEDKFDFLGLHLNSRFHLYKQDNQNIVRGGGGAA